MNFKLNGKNVYVFGLPSDMTQMEFEMFINRDKYCKSINNVKEIEFNGIDLKVLKELKVKFNKIDIYNEGDEYKGEKFSRVEISLFDLLRGCKIKGVSNADAIDIYKRYYPKHYTMFEKDLI